MTMWRFQSLLRVLGQFSQYPALRQRGALNCLVRYASREFLDARTRPTLSSYIVEIIRQLGVGARWRGYMSSGRRNWLSISLSLGAGCGAVEDPIGE